MSTNELYEGQESFDNPIRWLINVVRTLGFEYIFKRFYGTYRGIVVDIKDPEDRGRVRVLVPAVGHKTPEDVHPDIWALPKFPGLAVGEKGGGVDPEKFARRVGRLIGYVDGSGVTREDAVWLFKYGFPRPDPRMPANPGEPPPPPEPPPESAIELVVQLGRVMLPF